MSSPENALVQADKSKIDDGHPSGQNDWGVAALFNMITPHFFEYHRYSSSIRIEDVQNQQNRPVHVLLFRFYPEFIQNLS